ncbi:TRAP transporter small permease [Desulfosarcina widdelii]|uniref:TRAP transporter small permease n=1 Tax=Desulfosarcina widdelii TaxID=947919 RepID=UPI0012D35296|nr:TRAP transporter small permease [Desulfosarcina widdelii]
MKIIYSITKSVIVSCLALMVVLVVIDVAGRSMTGSGLPGTVEINEYLLVVVGFMGIFQTHHEKGHVDVNLLFSKFPLKLQVLMDRFNNILIILFSMLFIYAGVERLWGAFQSGETNWFGAYVLPVWFVRIVVPIGFFATGLQSLINLLSPNISSDEFGSS